MTARIVHALLTGLMWGAIGLVLCIIIAAVAPTLTQRARIARKRRRQRSAWGITSFCADGLALHRLASPLPPQRTCRSRNRHAFCLP